MAENDTSQERTEEPTPKRIRDARQEGQVARSRELNTTAVLMAGAAGMLIFGLSIGQAMQRVFQFNFTLPREHLFDPGFMVIHLGASVQEAGLVLMPFFGLLLLAALLGPVSLGGFIFAGKAMTPKLSRMDPVQGLKRIFSLKGLMELFKALIKFVVIAVLSVVILGLLFKDLMSLGNQDVAQGVAYACWILGWSFLALAAATILIAVVDVPFQLWEHRRKLRMTRQELKDEFKDTEGKPEVRSRVRQLQRELAQRRMMTEVPKADVVITNPEHYAVALRYDPDADGAPILLAKGEDFMALKIREVANKHDVFVLEEPPLARAVWHSTEIGREIPMGLYLAVAQVLAFVYQVRRYKPGSGKRPVRPEMPVPDDLRYDPE